MDVETEALFTERVAKVSKATFCLLISVVFLEALCVVLHSHYHEMACFFQNGALFLGGLALLRVGNSVSSVFPDSIRKVIHWIHASVFEFLVLLLVLALRLYSYFQKEDQPSEKKGTPILLVHGFVNTSGVWVYIKNFLDEEGFGPIYTVNLRRPFSSIEKHAQKVAEVTEKIRKETGLNELILIGHSMGGLVSAEYATQLAPKGSVVKILTIATPFDGTYMAKLAPGVNAREMERNSPFIRKLRQAIATRKDLNFYNIGTKTDLLVKPSSSSFLEVNEERRVEFDDIGHASLLFSPRVAAVLKNWLKLEVS